VKFTETRLKGAFLVELEALGDERGFFARSWCEREFREHGLDPALVQCNISFNKAAGTLRGMHYQAAPHAEAKLVRCTQGAIYDVVVDLRPESESYCAWIAYELTAQNHRMVFVPAGCAHGFQTLEPDSEVFYQMSAAYDAASARGVRWNDPAFAITWPRADPILSERDAAFADFKR
jgi:dTDP-4-dehydrorhamnose 3,5-epimerase